MKPANNAPVYCAIYPGLAEIARNFGYALTVHGSLARDFVKVTVLGHHCLERKPFTMSTQEFEKLCETKQVQL